MREWSSTEWIAFVFITFSMVLTLLSAFIKYIVREPLKYDDGLELQSPTESSLIAGHADSFGKDFSLLVEKLESWFEKMETFQIRMFNRRKA